LRLHLILFVYQTLHSALELAILGGVDERVDTAVGEHQHHGEVVKPVQLKEKSLRHKMDNEI